MKSLITEWNYIDKLLYKLGRGIDTVKETLFCKEPDVEEIITAETKHLKQENKQLKELQYPRKLERKDKNYICPNANCRVEIAGILIENYRIKYCPECGQRIYLNTYMGQADFL